MSCYQDMEHKIIWDYMSPKVEEEGCEGTNDGVRSIKQS